MHHADAIPSPTRRRWRTVAIVAVVAVMIVAAGVTLWLRSRPPTVTFTNVCGNHTPVGMVDVVPAVIHGPTIGQADANITELACVM